MMHKKRRQNAMERDDSSVTTYERALSVPRKACFSEKVWNAPC
jgi:hypothetical protein